MIIQVAAWLFVIVVGGGIFIHVLETLSNDFGFRKNARDAMLKQAREAKQRGDK